MLPKSLKFDVAIVGAGFAGMYMLHKLRQLGMSAVVFEAGDDVGGTWYWNRYPGARCDAESLAYSFSFSPELEQDWEWSERYAPQPEILEYARHVSRRFDLRKDIHFETRVTTAHYQDDSLNWHLETDKGHSVVARFCVMATGCLSVPQLPDIPGVQNFKGNLYQASRWPHEPVSFKNQRVGIIGTGSSGIQAIPVIAVEADHLTVFQRTPNFSVPAKNEPLDQGWVDEFKKNYRAHRENHKHAIGSGFGDLKIEPRDGPAEPILRSQLSEDKATLILEEAWETGGAKFMGAISDYYETYNRENVTLLSVKDNPIEKITESGVMVNGELTALDTLVLATGFDAMTGALLKIDIRGKEGLALSDKWHAGPRSYLGIAVADFPNLFTVTGPGSPSVLSNMLVSIEQHVDWMVDCMAHMKEQDLKVIEAQPQAEDDWVSHVNDVANMTLFPKGGSWYLGANVKGKPRIFMPYAAGVGAYREVCNQVTAKGYQGFTFH